MTKSASPTWTAITEWPGDDIALAVWAYILRVKDEDLDDDPENVIDRLRARHLTWNEACDVLGVDPTRRDKAIAAAWAGMARIATRRRDEAARALLAKGESQREVARVIGLSGTAAISRVKERTLRQPGILWQLDADTTVGHLQAVLAEGNYRNEQDLTPVAGDSGQYYPCSVAGQSGGNPPAWMTRLREHLDSIGVACEMFNYKPRT